MIEVSIFVEFICALEGKNNHLKYKKIMHELVAPYLPYRYNHSYPPTKYSNNTSYFSRTRLHNRIVKLNTKPHIKLSHRPFRASIVSF